jgi:hypothetical protein
MGTFNCRRQEFLLDVDQATIEGDVDRFEIGTRNVVEGEVVLISRA